MCVGVRFLQARPFANVGEQRIPPEFGWLLYALLYGGELFEDAVGPGEPDRALWLEPAP